MKCLEKAGCYRQKSGQQLPRAKVSTRINWKGHEETFWNNGNANKLECGNGCKAINLLKIN